MVYWLLFKGQQCVASPHQMLALWSPVVFRAAQWPTKKGPIAMSIPCFHLTPKILFCIALSEAFKVKTHQAEYWWGTPWSTSVYDLEATSNHSRIPVLDWDKPQASLPSLDKYVECTELCNFGVSSPYLQLYHPPLKDSSLQNQSTHCSEVY